MIVFDLETAPLPESELAALLPPFDPAEVRTGNLKDPDKIAAKLAEAEANHRRDFIDKAALDPITGRCLAVGVLDTDAGFRVIDGAGDEATLLREFWTVCRGDHGLNRMVGFNSNTFDLPFLIRRSWKHRVPVPLVRRGRYWSDDLVDLREIWQLNDRQARGSLDTIAKHLGIGTKAGNGAVFHKLWHADRARAVEYLKIDCELTLQIARVLGCL